MKKLSRTSQFVVIATAAGLTFTSTGVLARHCGGGAGYPAPGHYGQTYGKPGFYHRPMGFAYGQPMRPAYPAGYGRAAYGEPPTPDKTNTAEANDIIETAQAAGQFNTLIAAAKAAGLIETLKGDGPLTIFAPTDEAFAKLPEAELEALLNDKDALSNVLTYHVVPAKLTAVEIKVLTSARTVQGESLNLDTADGVKVNSANVVKPDVAARNGVIHIIDTVLIPNDSG